MTPATRWPLGIAVVLILTVGANVALYYVASSDQSFVIEPNYYAKAIAWDSTMAQARRNDSLSWHLDASLTPFGAKDGARLNVALTDSAGRPISGARVNVSAVPIARANSVLEAALAPDGSGYSTRLPVGRAGAWELKFEVTRGSDRFTSTARLDARPRA